MTYLLGVAKGFRRNGGKSVEQPRPGRLNVFSTCFPLYLLGYSLPCRAQATLLLLEAPADDSRNELLHTKLFTLLLGERYRSHTDVLFTYSQGAWQPATSGAITADDFDFLSVALRRAQSYFWAMSRNQIARDFHKVAWELQVIFSMPSDEALLEWQLSEVNNLKPEQKSKSWWLGLSELCRDLRKVLADHSRSIIKSFLRWSDSAMQDKRKPGIAFQDCSILSTLVVNQCS